MGREGTRKWWKIEMVGKGGCGEIKGCSFGEGKGNWRSELGDRFGIGAGGRAFLRV